MKTLIAIAAAVAVLATTGCCWPHHGGRYRQYDSWSDRSRPEPSRYDDRGGHDRRR